MNSNFHISVGSAPIILHVPHSSRSIPEDVRADLLLSDLELESELNEMTDTATDLIAKAAADSAKSKPYIFQNLLSRLVIDPERFPDEREAMNKVGMGAVYLKTSDGKNLRRAGFNPQGLIEKYFDPYAKAFTELTQSILDMHGKVLIIDVHSYRVEQHPNSINHDQNRPAMCIGTDKFHTSAQLRELAINCLSKVGDWYENEPYSGTYVPLKFYGLEPKVQSVMMECRADQFVDDSLQLNAGFKRVVSALANLIDG